MSAVALFCVLLCLSDEAFLSHISVIIICILVDEHVEVGIKIKMRLVNELLDFALLAADVLIFSCRTCS